MVQKSVIYRALPFAVFVLLTALQGEFGESSRYWVYALKTGVVAGLVIWLWHSIPEMRPAFSWEAVAAGIGVFVLWVGLDPFYPKMNELWARVSEHPQEAAAVWNPFVCFGKDSVLAWGSVAVRIIGAACLVPFVEEVFYRSLLYRFIIREKFEEVPFRQVSWMPFVVVSVIFGLVHQEWLAGILCGLVYQGLVCYKGRLGDAVTAHGITNLLLGIWVVWRGAWNFW